MATFSPIVDGAKWAGFDRIALVNDTFFMPLLFLVSGLFVWQRMKNRGVVSFLLGRFKRLDVPFILGIFVLMPLAFYPTMLEIKLVYGISQGFGEFWLNFVRGGLTHPGPLWFVWLLLAFDIAIALLYGRFSKLFSSSNRVSNLLLDNPWAFVLALFGLSVAAYLPMSNAFGPSAWMGIGPFLLRVSRGFLYLLYFLAGVAMGGSGVDASCPTFGWPIGEVLVGMGARRSWFLRRFDMDLHDSADISFCALCLPCRNGADDHGPDCPVCSICAKRDASTEQLECQQLRNLSLPLPSDHLAPVRCASSGSLARSKGGHCLLRLTGHLLGPDCRTASHSHRSNSYLSEGRSPG